MVGEVDASLRGLVAAQADGAALDALPRSTLRRLRADVIAPVRRRAQRDGMQRIKEGDRTLRRTAPQVVELVGAALLAIGLGAAAPFVGVDARRSAVETVHAYELGSRRRVAGWELRDPGQPDPRRDSARG